MDDWETLADDEAPVTLPVKSIANVNKWEGEDEEEDVKDSWEDEEEEEADEEKKDVEKVPVVKVKTKKSLAEKIAEREALHEAELEAKRKEREEQMSDEEKLAEKLRLQKIQEEADFRVALDTFGVTDGDLVAGAGVLDGAQPADKAELFAFKDELLKKVLQFKQVDGFAGFVEELVQGLCVPLVSIDLQKVKKTIDNLYTEKQKLEKEKSKKGAAKGKSKASLRMEGTNANIQSYDTYDYDDFM